MSPGKEKSSVTMHKKIAANRGSSWRKNLVAGRREVALNPSNMRIARLKKRIDQAHIAKKMDWSESTVGAIERARRMVKPDEAKGIASILGYPVQKLFTQKGKKLVAIISKADL